MKPEEQRIAIAEACPHACHKSLNEDAGYCWNSGTPWAHSEFDPLNDLNAMHEAENTIPRELMGVMAMSLSRIVGFHGVNRTGQWPPHAAYMWHATAAQRAEAFLRTLNLWKL